MRAHVRYGLVEVSGQLSALATPEWRERRGGLAGARRLPLAGRTVRRRKSLR